MSRAGSGKALLLCTPQDIILFCVHLDNSYNAIIMSSDFWS